MPICLKLKTIIVTNNWSILDTARSVKIIFGKKIPHIRITTICDSCSRKETSIEYTPCSLPDDSVTKS